jgi:hypothetical protein
MVRWAGRRAEPAPGRGPADGDHEASQPAVRFDPLIHPVAITGRCVIGNQIRVPAAGCAMAGCQAAFADPAALGEADNRARAIAAGWSADALGRLACPACQRDHPAPAWWVPAREPGTTGDHGPGDGTARPAGGTSQSIRPAVWGPLGAAQGRPHRAQWQRLLSALVSSRDGRTARAGLRIPGAGTMPGRIRTPVPRQGTVCMPPRSDYEWLNRSWRGRAGHRPQTAVAPRRPTVGPGAGRGGWAVPASRCRGHAVG